MRCSEFLRRYSDYRDGLIHDTQVIRLLSRHLEACGSCARYDASVRAGVQVLRRAAVEFEPAPGFRERLHARIAAGAEPVPVTPGAAGLAALLMLAAALALVINQRSGPKTPSADSRIAETKPAKTGPTPMVMVNPGVPFVTFTDLDVSAFHGTGSYNSPADIAIDTWANLPR